MTQRLFPQAIRIDLLEPETLRSLSARPERLRELLGARPEVLQVVIDEVQKLPELLEVAHLLYRGKERLLRDGILCLPCEEFLLHLTPNGFPS